MHSSEKRGTGIYKSAYVHTRNEKMTGKMCSFCVDNVFRLVNILFGNGDRISPPPCQVSTFTCLQVHTQEGGNMAVVSASRDMQSVLLRNDEAGVDPQLECFTVNTHRFCLPASGYIYIFSLYCLLFFFFAVTHVFIMHLHPHEVRPRTKDHFHDNVNFCTERLR